MKNRLFLALFDSDRASQIVTILLAPEIHRANQIETYKQCLNAAVAFKEPDLDCSWFS